MLTDTIASTHLGKKSEGSNEYDPSLLVAIPREENRKKYGIETSPLPSPKLGEGVVVTSSKKKLPFVGFDVWHAYEFSVLTENGLPVTRALKLRYDCASEYIVESKSLKLYLNSFNMTKLGKTQEECLSICKDRIEKDLSKKLETKVIVNFLDNNTTKEYIFSDFENIMNYVDETTLNFENFKESPEILEVEETENMQKYKLSFDSLRSNCRVTHQPDFGDAFIYYESKKHIKEESLVKYLVSFRSEYHFHEECVEMIFKRLSDILNPDDALRVCALYTRRGGIDICPYREKNIVFNEDITKLVDLKTFARYGIKQ